MSTCWTFTNTIFYEEHFTKCRIDVDHIVEGGPREKAKLSLDLHMGVFSRFSFEIEGPLVLLFRRHI